MDDQTPVVPDEIVLRPVGELIPYASNSRTHDDAQVSQIAESMREFGFTNPVLIGADDVIIAGHGRVLAAEMIGLTKVPTVCLGHLSPEQIKAYVIADNQLAMNAGWNYPMLSQELQELMAQDFDVALLGFDEGMLDDLINNIDFGDMNRELNLSALTDEMELKFKFNSDTYHAVRAKLQEYDESLEESLLKVLNLLDDFAL